MSGRERSRARGGDSTRSRQARAARRLTPYHWAFEEHTAGDFSPEHKAVLDDLLLGHPLARPGRMFGFPAYYAGKKLCICLYERGVGGKLPEQSAARLLETDRNIAPFRPLGRPRMREWIQITLSRSEDYRREDTEKGAVSRLPPRLDVPPQVE